jgi:uncharacterized membrane protein YqjE
MAERKTRVYVADTDTDPDYDANYKAGYRAQYGADDETNGRRYRSTENVQDYYTYHEPTLGELFSDLSRESSVLIREEVRLAQVEMTAKAKSAGRDVAFIAAGGFIAYAGFIILLIAAVVGLSYFMPDWLAALIVGLLVAIIGGIMAWSGLNDLKKIDPVPQQTVETIEEDREFLKEKMR